MYAILEESLQIFLKLTTQYREIWEIYATDTITPVVILAPLLFKRGSGVCLGAQYFMVSLERIGVMQPILKKIDYFVSGLSENIINNITKQELLEGYEREVDEENIIPEGAIGIINDVYPVMILGKNGWTKPVIEEATKSEINRAYIDSVYRSENQFEANFELNFMECTAEFSVPITVVEKLMNREDNETKNNVIFNIDIPFISDKGIKKFVSLEVFLEGFNRGDYTNKQISFFNFGE